MTLDYPKFDRRFNEKLGLDIALYWMRLGFRVTFVVEPVDCPGIHGFHQVRSNMVNGLPVERMEKPVGGGL